MRGMIDNQCTSLTPNQSHNDHYYCDNHHLLNQIKTSQSNHNQWSFWRIIHRKCRITLTNVTENEIVNAKNSLILNVITISALPVWWVNNNSFFKILFPVEPMNRILTDQKNKMKLNACCICSAIILFPNSTNHIINLWFNVIMPVIFERVLEECGWLPIPFSQVAITSEWLLDSWEPLPFHSHWDFTVTS